MRVRAAKGCVASQRLMFQEDHCRLIVSSLKSVPHTRVQNMPFFAAHSRRLP
jgi:hypothetical protein